MKKTLIALMALAGSCYAEDSWIKSGTTTLDYSTTPVTVTDDATLYNYLYGVFHEGGTLTFSSEITWDGNNCNAYQSILHVGRGDWGGSPTGFSIYANGAHNFIVTERANTSVTHEAANSMVANTPSTVIITLTGLTETPGTASASVTVDGVTQNVANLSWSNMAWDTSEDEDTQWKERIKYTLGQKAPGYTGQEIQTLSIGTMTVTYSASIPEPTTATLSLLALCGLAARRRRK